MRRIPAATDVSGGGYMGTSAELDGRAELDDTHMVTVFFTEKGDGTQLLGFFDRNVAVFLQRYVGTDLGVDDVFHLADFFIGHFLEVREVEAQGVRSYQRTLLFHMVAEYFAECGVQQVGT